MSEALSEWLAGAADAEFLRVFNRLCVGLREVPDDSGVTQATYFDALKDLPIEALEVGANALMKESGRRFFPTTAEWREHAEKAATAHLREALPHREEPWQDECVACHDTGWEYDSCPGDETCQRRKKHAAHPFVRVCPCRPTNRTYQRKQRFGAGA